MKLLVSLLSAVTRGAILVGDYPFSPSITVVPFLIRTKFSGVENNLCFRKTGNKFSSRRLSSQESYFHDAKYFQCRVIYVTIPCEAFRLPPIRLRVCQLRRVDITWWAKYCAEFDFADTADITTWSQHCYRALQRQFPSDWNPWCPRFHVCGRIFPSRRRGTDQNTGVSSSFF